MKPAANYRVVMVTTPDLKTARHLARQALTARLAACANILPKIESHYWWQGKLERGAEALVIFKSTTRHLARLEELIVAEHPYDTPEFIAWSLSNGNRRYLEWLTASCGGFESRTRKRRIRP